MQEEVSEKTIALIIKGTKLTGQGLAKAMSLYLRHRQKVKAMHHGKMKVKKLLGMDQGVSMIDVGEDGYRDFGQYAKKYNIDFALEKDTDSDPPKFICYFKGRDADVISLAFKKYVSDKENNRVKPSIRTKLEQFKQKSKDLAEKLDKTKHLHQEQAL